MCLWAIYWARPSVVYYANTKFDAALIGFDDAMIYEEAGIDPENRKIPSINLCRAKALKVFENWASRENKNVY
jgi:tRNA(Arg) A34 adenosine deaminase TadA